MYAPIGLVLDAPKYLPELAEKGRGQVALAKVIGKIAVDRMEKELGPFAAFIRAAAAWDPSSTCGPRRSPNAAEPSAAPPDPASTTAATTADRVSTDGLADSAGPADTAGPTEPVAQDAKPKTRAAAATRGARSAGSGAGTTAGKSRAAKSRTPTPQEVSTQAPDAEQVPDEAQLPIDGFVTLSASQIVPRLTTLAPAELAAIGRFERANRNRRTVLNRIDQLLGDR